MHTHDLRAFQHARVDLRPLKLERALAAFAPNHAKAVRALAQSHRYLEDLALSFPALLFALAVPRDRYDPTAAISKVIAGAPLAEIAAAGAVPLWLRNFPISGLVEPLPPLPDGDLVRRQIANHLPRARFAVHWIRHVSIAASTGTDQFAVWVAREYCSQSLPLKDRDMRCIALWAWFSSRNALPQVPLPRRWTPAISLKCAKAAARDWLRDVHRYIQLGDGIVDVWHTRRFAADYEFVPLRSPADLRAEGDAMHHCIETYSFGLARNRVRVWSIRRDGERVATLELQRPGNGPIPQIAQIKAARNQPAPNDIWFAAFEWLTAFDARHTDLGRCNAAPPIRGRWRSVWRPYWLAKGRIPSWLPIVPISLYIA